PPSFEKGDESMLHDLLLVVSNILPMDTRSFYQSPVHPRFEKRYLASAAMPSTRSTSTRMPHSAIPQPIPIMPSIIADCSFGSSRVSKTSHSYCAYGRGRQTTNLSQLP